MSVSVEDTAPARVLASPAPSMLTQLLVFMAIGGGAALGFVALSTAMIGLHGAIADWIVSALCYALFIVPVYLAHRRFSFRSDAPHRHAMPRYVAVQCCGLLLASLFSYIVYALNDVPALPASLLVIGLTSGVNFMLLRLWAFGTPK